MNAFANTPFDEALEWKSARTGLVGSFRGTVLHGQSMSESAGANRGRIAADPWSVVIDAAVGLVADLKAGDTIIRRDYFDTELTVQQINRDPVFGWNLICTANERSPR